MTEKSRLRPGQWIVVRTPDRREYRGQLVELRAGTVENATAVVRLDTGWLTSYPITMVHALDDASDGT